MQPSIAALIVTYNCGARLHTMLAALSPQVANIIIVDNASNAETLSALEEAQRTHSKLHIIRNRENVGLAAAQNQGIRHALEKGATWVLLLDDDSVPETNMVSTMLEAHARDTGNIGIVAPRYIEQQVNTPTHYLALQGRFGKRKALRAGEVVHDAASVIASGSLIRGEVFPAIGLMREGYFIDYIDHDFCFRAREGGFGILMVGDAMLRHSQGNKSRHKLLGKTIVTNNYNPRRRYTIFRNRIFTMREHAKHFSFLAPYAVLTCGWDLFRIVMVESDKRAKINAALRGAWDGLTKAVPLVPKL